MANGLLDLLGGLGTTPPSYIEGLLGQQATEDLHKRSIGTGLANALVGYLAMPKNQNLGLGRILAGTAQAGMQGAQGVYDTATQDYLQNQKIEEMKRQREQQLAQQEAINQVAQNNPQLGQVLQAYPQAAAGVLEKMYTTKEAKATGKPLSIDDIAALKAKGVNLDTSAGQQYQMKPDGTIEPINTAPSGTTAGTTLDKLVAARARLVAANPNDPNIKLYDSAINKETNFAPPMQAVTNVQNFVPAAQQLQKSAAEGLVKNYELLQNAPQTIQTMEQAKALVPSAINFTGSLGEQKLQFAKFFNNNFGTNIDPAGIQSAEQLRSAMFTNVMDNLKKMDASPSQQQQAVMAKAFGTLDTDPKSLPKIIDIYQNILKQKVQTHNTRVDQISKKVELPYDLKVNLPDIAPQGETPQQRIDRIKRERMGGK